MTAYQVLHGTAKARGETVLVHGAAGRVGVAALELGAVAGLRLYGTASARDRAKVEALGAVAIDYRTRTFWPVCAERRAVSTSSSTAWVVRSPCGPSALRPGGRLVVFGRYDTLKDGHKDWPGVIKWYAAIAAVWLWDKLSPRRRVSAYHVQKYRDKATRRDGAVGGEPMDPEQFREDFGVLVELLRQGKIHPVVAERCRCPRLAAPMSCSSRRRRSSFSSLGRRGRSPMARYLPIAEHGLIGDLHTVALVGTDGTIDWYCCPRFDSPRRLRAILDADRGGRFRITPDCDGCRSKQLYLPDANVLITRFLTPDGVGEVQDFMSPPRAGEPHRHRMIRRVLTVRGEMRFVVEVAPRFDYARARHGVALTGHGALFRSPELELSLSTSTARDRRRLRRPRVSPCGPARRPPSCSTVEPGETPAAYSDDDIAAEFDATVAYWRRWLGRSEYSGRWREMVHRSALTLKLLTYAPTGSPPTTPRRSVARCWHSLHLDARRRLLALRAAPARLRRGGGGVHELARGRFRFAADRESGPLQIMYGVDGREHLDEEELSTWRAMGSAPVRIGNGAATQLQLDIYGELMDSVYLYNKYGKPLYHDGWLELTRNLEWLIEHWDQPDEGIWETRGGRRATYSRLMCWVAVERAIRIARHAACPPMSPAGPQSTTASTTRS